MKGAILLIIYRGKKGINQDYLRQTGKYCRSYFSPCPQSWSHPHLILRHLPFIPPPPVTLWIAVVMGAGGVLVAVISTAPPLNLTIRFCHCQYMRPHEDGWIVIYGLYVHRNVCGPQMYMGNSSPSLFYSSIANTCLLACLLTSPPPAPSTHLYHGT